MTEEELKSLKQKIQDSLILNDSEKEEWIKALPYLSPEEIEILWLVINEEKEKIIQIINNKKSEGETTNILEKIRNFHQEKKKELYAKEEEIERNYEDFDASNNIKNI
jgi:hypothetical protein